MTEHRAVFDFTIRFTNGGSMTGEGFRLDVTDVGMSADDVGALLVGHLGLLMVADVELSDLEFVAEAHRGSRGIESAPPPRRVVDLGHDITAATVGPSSATSSPPSTRPT